MKRLVAGLIALALVVGMYNVYRPGGGTRASSHGEAPPIDFSSPFEATVVPGALETLGYPEFISVTYMDWALTMEELTTSACLIVRGELVAQYQYSGLAVANVLRVSSTLKGDHLEEIMVFQVGSIQRPGSDMLKAGTEYILFLGKQGEPSPDNSFFIISGNTGVFSSDSSGKLVGREDLIAELKSTEVTEDVLYVVEAGISGLLRRD
jgi:hypothetical protein